MRVNYRRTSRNKNLFLVAVFGGVLLLLIVLLPILLATTASYVIVPIAKTKTWFAESTSSLPQFLRERSALISEIQSLEENIASASGNRSTIDSLVKENEELRSLLGYEGEKRILAGIIGRPDTLPNDTLMLDRGSQQGVLVGAPVFINDSTIIGIVRFVTPQSSLVELITTPDFETTVFIVGPDIFTTAVGVGGGQLRVGVPQGIPLEVGNLVVIPSVTSGVYGEINVVNSVPSKPEQYGFVSPQIPLSSMRLVSIGSTPVTPISFEEAQVILAGQRERLLIVPVPEDKLIEIDSATSTATSTPVVERMPSNQATTASSTRL